MNNLDNDTLELLKALSTVCKRGPIETSLKGSNAVGKLLQEELGIIHDTKRRNSFCGFTVTATARAQSSGRTNLFACVPDWGCSTIKSSTQHVQTHGKEDRSRGYSRSMFCTLNSLYPNSFGLYLKANPSQMQLEEWLDKDGLKQRLLIWDTTKLLQKLNGLGRSAIVTGLPINLNGSKAYHYRYVQILGKPEPATFFRLLADGAITVDHCVSIAEGKKTAREQGPLFKVSSEAREELYGSFQKYDLFDF
ncbi:MvaI/BcnI family restriction endonuclease [Vibrio cyclitrophicus]